MNLKVVAKDWACGQRSHILTTEDGTLLPGQRDVTINHNFRGESLITAWDGNPAISAKGPQVLADYTAVRGYIDHWEGSRSVFNFNYRNRSHPGRLFVPAWADAWAAGLGVDGCVVVEAFVRRPSSPGKDWGYDRWRDAAAFVGADWRAQHRQAPTLIQMADRPIKTIPGARFIKTPTFWHAAAIIARSALVLTPEGGTHHMAGALRRPAVVVCGGFTHPDVIGYDGHEYLYADVPGSPCGRFDHCPHCVDALNRITPAMVADATGRLLDVQDVQDTTSQASKAS